MKPKVQLEAEPEVATAPKQEPLLPGDRVFYKFSERCTYPAFIQGFNPDGSARLWVASVMSMYRHDCGEGENIGQYSRVYTEPTNTRPLPPEYQR